WPLLFWMGTLLTERAELAWALLPPLQTLLVFIPLWWLVVMGLRFLKMNHTPTQWSVIGVSMLVTPSVMVFLEILVFGLAFAGFAVWAASRPGIIAELEQLALRIANAPMEDPEVLERILMPYLQKPGVITGALVLVSGLIPFIEEIFKPLALWFLIPRKLTPREGFALGMISGAVFALIESLGNLVNPLAEMWSTVMIGRLGTGLLHVLTSALVGWGIASAWTHRRVLRLFLAYLAAVVLHGVWNFFALLLGFSSLIVPSAASSLSEVYAQAAQFAPYVLGLLSALMLFLLFSRSRKLGQDPMEESFALPVLVNMEKENERINPDQ
ncbi:MAG: PrsW family glutamic-type intramembrane protease, partial [Anaerolineaceae bacterium]|nr:PrsW family glutamic-type intramembrane protease [Anaerolineaceae bacterium]